MLNEEISVSRIAVIAIAFILVLSIVGGGFSFVQARIFEERVDRLESVNQILSRNYTRIAELNRANQRRVGELEASLSRASAEADRGRKLIDELSRTVGEADGTLSGLIETVQEIITSLEDYGNTLRSLSDSTSD